MPDLDHLPLRRFKVGCEGAARFAFEKHFVMIYCHRLTDKEQVEELIAEHNLSKPKSAHEIKKFGFRIVIDDNGLALYRNSKFPVKEGEQKWVFNIRLSTKAVQSVYGVSIQITSADEAIKVDFSTQTKIEAAFKVYEDRIKDAQIELQNEILRITQGALTDKLKFVPNNPKPPVALLPSKPVALESLKPKKRLAKRR